MLWEENTYNNRYLYGYTIHDNAFYGVLLKWRLMLIDRKTTKNSSDPHKSIGNSAVLKYSFFKFLNILNDNFEIIRHTN